MSNEKSPHPVHEIVPLFYVQEMSRSIHFYCDQLGMTRTMSWEPDGRLKWCRLELGGAAMMLQLAEGEIAGNSANWGQGTVFFLNCDDVDSLCSKFIDNGLQLPEIGVAFYGMKQLELVDPDGYQLCFQSPVTEPGT